MLLFRVLRHKNCTAAFTFTKNETDHRAIQTNKQTGNQRYSKAIADQKRKMYCALCSMRYCAWCIVQCAMFIVQCYIVDQVRFLVADLLNSSHPRQLQSTPTFGVCMRRMIIMENKEECIKEARICWQLSVLTLT